MTSGFKSQKSATASPNRPNSTAWAKARNQAVNSNGSTFSASIRKSHPRSRSTASRVISSSGSIRVISGTRRRAMIDSVSACMAALVAAEWPDSAASSSSIRSARLGKSQSRDRKYGKRSGTILLLALTKCPVGGLVPCGSSANGIKPVQSYSPVQPGTGSQPLPFLRIGMLAGAIKPIVPSMSA